MKLKFKTIRDICVYLFVIMDLIIFCVWQNNDIVTTNIEYINSKIPKGFEGYKIVQISDLHNKAFGKNQYRLLNKIEKEKLGIIVITGDLIDRNRTNIDIAMEFIKGAVVIAPVYYVAGNHEAGSGVYTQLASQLTAAGVTVLDDKSTQIQEKDSFIELIGLSDPSFTPSDYLEHNSTYQVGERLKKLTENNKEEFKILLSHRPDLFGLYKECKIDLDFSGHAHGGQIRLPFIGGIIAPNQGFFPKYTSGAYNSGDTTMIVSRGLGNSTFPIRIFNRPEIVVVTLKKK